MKGRAKDRIKLALIILATLVATVIIVSLISGRLSTQEIIIVDREGINMNQPLEEQLEFFKSIEISKDEYEQFGGTIATDFSQLTNKIPRYELPVGSPVTFNMLMDPDAGGRFATSLEEGKTVYFLPQGGVGLPPIESGDKINLGISYQSQNEFGENQHVSSILLYDLELINVIGFDFYAEVTLQQHLILNTASKVGDFFVQLPGKNTLPFCSDLTDEEIEADTNCLEEDYLPESISQSYITERLSRGEALNRTDKEIERELRNMLEEIDAANEEAEENEDEETEDTIVIPTSLDIGGVYAENDFSVTVNEVTTSESEAYGELTNDYFIVAGVTIENTSEEPINLNTILDIKLRDADGNIFELSSDLLNSLDRMIEPGESLDGSFPFDATESDEFEIYLNDFDTAVWSFDSNSID